MPSPPPLNLRRIQSDQPLRWRRAKGDPTCLIEWLFQKTWLLIPYIAVVVTIVLILQFFGL